MNQPKDTASHWSSRFTTRYPSFNASTANTLLLVLLAMGASWAVALISSTSARPVVAMTITNSSFEQEGTVADESDVGEALDAAVSAVAIAGPLDVTPTSTIQVTTLNTSTRLSAEFETLMAGRRVHVVGDSLALSAKNEIEAIFGDAVTVEAEAGLGLYYASNWIATAATDPDIVVVALGTNDFNEPSAFIDSARLALETLAAAPCVVWVDTQPFHSSLVEINSGLVELSIEYGTYVAAWSELAGPEDLHAADGYHLSFAGQDLFATLIAATIDATCLRR